MPSFEGSASIPSAFSFSIASADFAESTIRIDALPSRKNFASFGVRSLPLKRKRVTSA